jgi:hypothetical protein
MVTVSERSSVDAPAGGNLVAMMIVLLPVGEAHPVRRLERIANETAERKRRHVALAEAWARWTDTSDRCQITRASSANESVRRSGGRTSVPRS